MILAQATTDGFDFAKLIGTGGPVGGICLILGFLAKLWLDSRKDKREDRKTDRESESGIVETTSAAIKLVREQMIAMSNEMSVLRTQLEERENVFRARLTERDERIEKLEERVRGLEIENEQLRRRAHGI